MLDANSNTPDKHIQKIAPVRRILPEDYPGVRKYLKRASIRNLENGVPVHPSDNQVSNMNRVPKFQRPRLRILQNRYLTALSDHLSGIIVGIKGGYLAQAQGGACRYQ
jgi:hypothetical protein